jgi:uncharacterized protein (DUF1800 family)
MALTQAEAAHFLRRTGFGGSMPEITALMSKTRAQAVDEAMDFSAVPPAPEPTRLRDENHWWAHADSVLWWTQRMATTPKPLQEKLALFWHNHFCSGMSKIDNMVDLFTQNQAFRTGGLGSFKQLLTNVSFGGAMLVYLDNDVNKKGNVQENFAREVMELFTLGVGNYIEADIVAMAKAWTGHNVVGWNGSIYDTTYKFFPTRHDTTTKTMFGIARNWDAADTIEELVNGTKQADCARFIARKLYKWFVHTNPSDAVVQELANVFVANSMSIGPLVRAILMHDDFWSAAARYALVKSPVEFVVDVMKRAGTGLMDSGTLRYLIEPMGQLLFEPPNVAGWGQNDYWLSTATMWARGRFAEWLGWRIDDADVNFMPELTAPTSGPLTMTAAQFAQYIFDKFAIVEPSTSTRTRLESWYTANNANNGGQRWAIRPHAAQLAILCPEFQVV